MKALFSLLGLSSHGDGGAQRLKTIAVVLSYYNDSSQKVSRCSHLRQHLGALFTSKQNSIVWSWNLKFKVLLMTVQQSQMPQDRKVYKNSSVNQSFKIIRNICCNTSKAFKIITSSKFLVMNLKIYIITWDILAKGRRYLPNYLLEKQSGKHLIIIWKKIYLRH